jgi:hypothetical protein
MLTLAGTAPKGWFLSPDVDPSDPAIPYQLLIGTVVD